MVYTAGLQRVTDVEHSRALGDSFLVQLCRLLECLSVRTSPGGLGIVEERTQAQKTVCQTPQGGFEVMSNLSFSSRRLQTDQEPGPVPQESRVLDGYTSPPLRTEDSFSCVGKYPGKDFLYGTCCLNSSYL